MVGQLVAPCDRWFIIQFFGWSVGHLVCLSVVHVIVYFAWSGSCLVSLSFARLIAWLVWGLFAGLVWGLFAGLVGFWDGRMVGVLVGWLEGSNPEEIKWGQTWSIYPFEETQQPFYRRLGGPQGLSGLV
jgi:hypothetical protein